AGIMVGCFSVEGSAKVIYMEHFRQKFGKLIHAFGEFVAGNMFACIFKKPFVIVACKTRTRATGRYDIVFPFKILDEFFGYGSCLFPVSGIESRLSAAGLFGII